MKKSMLAIAFVLATSLTFAQTTPANPPAGSTDSSAPTKTKKHHKKATQKPATKTPAAATPAAPATK